MTEKTPRSRQLEVLRRNIEVLERLGHHYAAHEQRKLLEQLEETDALQTKAGDPDPKKRQKV